MILGCPHPCSRTVKTYLQLPGWGTLCRDWARPLLARVCDAPRQPWRAHFTVRETEAWSPTGGPQVSQLLGESASPSRRNYLCYFFLPTEITHKHRENLRRVHIEDVTSKPHWWQELLDGHWWAVVSTEI